MQGDCFPAPFTRQFVSAPLQVHTADKETEAQNPWQICWFYTYLGTGETHKYFFNLISWQNLLDLNTLF